MSEDRLRGVEKIPPDLRIKDEIFHHIDMGFLNKRLCMTALPSPVRDEFARRVNPGNDHFTSLANDHLLVTTLLDVCNAARAPTLVEALALDRPKLLFKSTERLHACPEVYSKQTRVEHKVHTDIDFGKPISIAYNTSHLVSDTGTMTLSEGCENGYVQSIVGLLHNKPHKFEIEPLVIGAPWLDHPRNGEDGSTLVWMGKDFGELLPEDIDQFSLMSGVTASTEEWTEAMRKIPESQIKAAFAKLLSEPTKRDWGGEENDHFSNSVSVRVKGRQRHFC